MRIEIETDLKKGRPRELAQGARPPAHRLRERLLLAHQVKGLLDSGQAKNLAHVAGWLGYTAPRIYQVMNLLLLAPSIQREILTTDLRDHPGLNERRIRLIPLEPIWGKQEAMWREVAGPAGGGPA